jgi:ribose transport system substrate-binding protein
MTLTAFERRQRVLDLLRQQHSVRVTELAERFDVSKVTIRSDLDALESKGHVNRVRGGAVLAEEYSAYSAAFAARAQVNAPAKQRIGRWAADLVEDGDAVLLDGSTSIFHMLPFLQKKRNLTVITNNIEAGTVLAENAEHRVILVGGVLSRTGALVTGPLAERNLESLHVRLAFVSCSGLSREGGLTQTDIDDARLKSKVLDAADQVVALVDSTKFGRRELTAFAEVAQIDHIFTDSDLDPRHIDALRGLPTVLTVCGENSVTSFTLSDGTEGHYRIGFANISEDQSPFAVEVRHGLERAAQEAGLVDLVVVDNQLDGRVALDMADHLISDGVDLVIEYQIDEQMGASIASKFHEADIPVIAVDIPMVGATFFGVDNYRAGRMAGLALGRWLNTYWDGEFDRVIVLQEPRAGSLPAARIQGQLDGLSEVVGEIPPGKLIHLDTGNTHEASQRQVARVLTELPDAHRLAVVSFNDSTTMGALDAAREAGREADVVIVGQGADRRVRQEIRRPGSRVAGATAYWPERYGERLLNIALRILHDESVPPAVYIDHVLLNAENIDRYYPEAA